MFCFEHHFPQPWRSSQEAETLHLKRVTACFFPAVNVLKMQPLIYIYSAELWEFMASEFGSASKRSATRGFRYDRVLSFSLLCLPYWGEEDEGTEKKIIFICVALNRNLLPEDFVGNSMNNLKLLKILFQGLHDWISVKSRNQYYLWDVVTFPLCC